MLCALRFLRCDFRWNCAAILVPWCQRNAKLFSCLVGGNGQLVKAALHMLLFMAYSSAAVDSKRDLFMKFEPGAPRFCDLNPCWVALLANTALRADMQNVN